MGPPSLMLSMADITPFVRMTENRSGVRTKRTRERDSPNLALYEEYNRFLVRRNFKKCNIIGLRLCSKKNDTFRAKIEVICIRVLSLILIVDFQSELYCTQYVQSFCCDVHQQLL